MEFGSKYVYNYPDSEEEVVSEEELEDGLNAWKNTEVISRPKSDAGQRPGNVEYDSDKSSSTEEIFDCNYPKLVTCVACPPPVPLDVPDTGVTRPTGAAGPPPLPERNSADPTARKGKKQKKKGHKKRHHWLETDSKEKAGKDPVAGRRWRRADTNVLSVKFGHLTSASNMHTGDPVHCNNCGAVLSHISKIQNQESEKVWTCEYCYEKNIVDQDDEEIPQKDDVTFMLQPAPTTTSSGRSGVDESLIVFCIDTSGSMCVTTEVPGKVKLRGDHLDSLQSLNRERQNQYMPGQCKDVTFVSRLQGVQAAVDSQLSQMAKEHPDRRVALVTFNSEVAVVGDGDSAPIHYAGDKLLKKEDLKAAGLSLDLPHSIQSVHKTLSNKVFDLEEGGQTALGPALLISVAMASQVKGSKVIICTDGMANVGLGALDNNNIDEFNDASGFYQDISQFATDNGTSVSVITIKGTACKLAELGQVASNTGGQVNIVDPLKLTQEFDNILADATIATNVQATLILHKGLYFRNEPSSSSKLTRQIGNVTKDTEITFEYGIKKRQNDNTENPNKEPAEVTQTGMDCTEAGDHDTKKTDSAMEASSSSDTSHSVPSIDNLQELPFQLHLIYTDLDGAQAMRVLTKTKPITTDRQQAEKEMNSVLLGVHGTKQSAQLALGGKYTNSRLNGFMYQRLMYRNCDRMSVRDTYDCYLKTVSPIDGHIQTVQQREVRTTGHTYSDSEDDEDDNEAQCGMEQSSVPLKAPRGMLSKAASFFKPSKPVKKKAILSRRMECPDESANVYYSAQKSCSNSVNWNKKK